MAKRKKNPSGKTWLIIAGAGLAALGLAGWAAAKGAKKAVEKLKTAESYTETTNGWKIEVVRKDIDGMPRYFAYVTEPGPGAVREPVGNVDTGYTTMNEALNVARELLSEIQAPTMFDWPSLPPGFEQLDPVDQGFVEAPDGYRIEWQLLDTGAVGPTRYLVVYRSTTGHGFNGAASTDEAQQFVLDTINQQK